MDVFVRLLNAIIMIAMPLALGVLLVKRLGVTWRLFAIGATGFFVSQVLHIPFNILVLSPLLDAFRAGTGALIITATLAGLSAGVIEEFSRYFILRYWLKKERSWDQMLMYGLGHGGFEAMLLGAWALYVFFQAFALRGADLGTLVPPEQVQAATSNLLLYWDLPWQMALLGALERALAVCLHLGLTALVWQAVVRGSIAWVVMAVFWHASANAGALIINQTWGAYHAEGFLALMAVISLYFLLALRRRSPAPMPATVRELPQAQMEIEGPGPAEDETRRSLRNSRYLE
jgi:uncharacterized membrane protein YhfC